MADIFISYAREDLQRIQPLKDALEAYGWTVCWDQDLLPGDEFRESIEKLIDGSACLVVVWTNQSVAVRKRWVRAEVDRGLLRDIVIPVLLDEGLAIPLPFSEIHAVSLVGWDERKLPDRLVAAISERVAATPLVQLLRHSDKRSSFQGEGTELYDDVCLVINSFGQESCRFAKIVRDQCDNPRQLHTSERYNRFDVIPIFVMCDDALVELDNWYGKSVARQEDPDRIKLDLGDWINHVLMLTSILVNRLAVSLKPSSYTEQYLLRVCAAFLQELSLTMHDPPSGKTLFCEAARAVTGSPDDVLQLLRESDVRLTSSE